jgi:hypothetical protein
MAISSFSPGTRTVRIVGDEQGQDQKIGSEDNALKVAGTFLFEEDFIQTFPKDTYQAFLNSTVCLYKSMIKELKIMNQHLSSMSDLEDMEVEPGNDEGAM